MGHFAGILVLETKSECYLVTQRVRQDWPFCDNFRLRPVQVCCLGYRKPAFSIFFLFMSVPCKARVAIRMESHQFLVDVGSDGYHFLHYVMS